MDLGINARVALVTGGSRGIGKAVAEELAKGGCRVSVVARSGGPIDATVAQLRAQGLETIGISADCTSREGVADAVAQTTEAFGPPDIAVYNVASGPRGGFDDVDDDDFLAGFRSNVLGLRWLVQETVEHMKISGWGRYVTIGTMAMKQPHRALSRVVADTTRMGTVGLNKHLATNLGSFGITMNILGTGSIETNAFRETFGSKATELGLTYDEIVQRKVEQTPVGRLGQPQDMAAACAFLCSDRAGFITGQVLLVDGGRVEGLM